MFNRYMAKSSSRARHAPGKAVQQFLNCLLGGTERVSGGTWQWRRRKGWALVALWFCFGSVLVLFCGLLVSGPCLILAAVSLAPSSRSMDSSLIVVSIDGLVVSIDGLVSIDGSVLSIDVLVVSIDGFVSGRFVDTPCLDSPCSYIPILCVALPAFQLIPASSPPIDAPKHPNYLAHTNSIDQQGRHRRQR